MQGIKIVTCGLALLSALWLIAAAGAKQSEQRTLRNGFFGLADPLAGQGIDVGLSATSTYQQNVRGGLSTHRRAGRNAGSYDLTLDGDGAKLLGIDGGRVYVHTEGMWSKAGGIDEPSVGSAFGVNGDAAHREAIYIRQLWYEQALANDELRLRIGKMDLTAGFEHHNCPVSFDCSSYADNENSQFLNGALIDNPTIPFPDYGLGVAAHYEPHDFWYVSAAVADAQAGGRETGLRTTFCGEDYFFYILETGITPLLGSEKGALPGAYRLGIWYDPRPKANSDYAEEDRMYRGDTGLYTTCDQMLLKENDQPEDTQGLGAFFRFGCADSKRNDIANFWSFGFQYQGPFEGRDEDVLGVGFAHGSFSDKASATYTDDYEAVYEAYYNIAVAPWFAVSPDLQYVVNPGGNADAVVIGLRVRVVL